jgi:hypothetical protein
VESYPVQQKLVISGQFVEYYKYSRSYWRGVSPYPRRLFPIIRFSPPVQDKIRDDNAKRAGTKIRRLVNSNPQLDRFLTLTYATPILDLETSNKIFTNFIKRLKRLFPDLQYLAVPEFQKSSKRVHYHLLCNLPYIEVDTITDLWGQGFCFLRKINNVTNLGAYISKYLTKESFDTRYFKKRKFFYSYTLLKPITVDKLKKVYTILKNLPVHIPIFCELLYKNKFTTKFLGMVSYKQYRLAKFIRIIGGTPPAERLQSAPN